MDCSIDRVVSAQAKSVFKEALELGSGHFPGGANKLAPLYATSAASIALDANIIGRVMKSHFGDLAQHKLVVGLRIARIADEEPVAAQNKHIADLRDGRTLFKSGDFIGRIWISFTEVIIEAVNFSDLEAEHRQVKADFR
jgi:hypothetical protein